MSSRDVACHAAKRLVLGTVGALAAVACLQAPSAASAAPRDSDRDGLSNRFERTRSFTNPRRADTDRDGLSDRFELRTSQTSPRNRDTDGDGLSDRDERRRFRTDPRVFDTDGDATGDGLEVLLGRDPLKPDPAVPPPPPPPPPPDTTAPETSIGSGPSGTVASGSASFAFSSSEPGSSFECRLDTAGWSGCSSPQAYGGLANGPHSFSVRARDPAGNTDPSPASRDWTVNVPPPGSVTLTPVDGGPDYYGQFSGSLPTSPDYFPIGVWGAYDFTAQNVAKDKDVGINTYVWNADTAAWGQQSIAAAGMYTLQEAGDNAGVGAHTRGWMLSDEPDMRLGPGNNTTTCDGPHHSGNGAWSGYQEMRAKLAQVPDNRVTYANYGKGIVGPQWETDAQASCFVNAFQDITSADLYWHTDPNEASRPQSGTSWGYGQTVDRLRELDARDGRRHPIWNFVEVAWPWSEPEGTSGLTRISGAEIRGAVWHSIIAGARGIIYFQHQFSGSCPTHHALRGTGTACYGAVIDSVRSINTQIKSLAPVLNAPTVTSGVSTSSSIRAMVKWQGGNFYVFAGSRNNTSSTGTVSIPCVGDATATRLGEAGSVPISGGSFSDQFADGNAIHIYRIDGGSACGVPAG